MAESFLLDSDFLQSPEFAAVISEYGKGAALDTLGILCMLRNCEQYRYPYSRLNALAYGLHAERDAMHLLVDFLVDIGFLEIEGENEEFFYSPGLRKRMERYEDIKEKRSKSASHAARMRWDALRNKTKSNRTKSNNKKDSVDLSKLSEDFKQSFERWFDYRTERNLPRTERYLNGLIKKWGDRPGEFKLAVENSIENYYQGLFAPKVSDSRQTAVKANLSLVDSFEEQEGASA